VKFSVTAHHNEYLPAGDAGVDVIVTVRAEGDPGGPAAGSEPAEVILLDCSGSMGAPQAKMRSARLATIAAVDALPDGAAFAVVGGNHQAEMIYPAGPGPTLAVAGEGSRAQARKAISRAWPHGGTAIGTWLRLSRLLLAQRPATAGHVVLLTDGRNETETAEELRAELEACTGQFTVDCWGIGSAAGLHDWDGAELLGIAEVLGANPVVPVEDAGTLAAEITRRLGRVLAVGAGDVRLLVRTTQNAQVRFLKQVHPVIADLSERGAGQEYPTGAWSPGDRRDYHLALQVGAMPAGTRRRIAWCSAYAASTGDSPDRDETGVTVEWTDDFPLFSAVHPTVAHYSAQQTLAEAIRLGTAALQDGDRPEAVRQFGRAVALAHAARDAAKLALLDRLIVVEDAPAGRVRLRDDADLRRLPPLTVSGPRTSTRDPEPIPPWQHCGSTWTSRFCGTCGTRFDQAA
jgi:hypothetical protein